MRRNTRSGLSGPFDRGWRSGFSAPFTLGAAGAAAVSDAYAIGGASPELVAAFTLASDGTTAGEYYRKASSETTFSGLFTHSVSGLLTMFDSSGTLVWAPHNLFAGDSDGLSFTSLSSATAALVTDGSGPGGLNFVTVTADVASTGVVSAQYNGANFSNIPEGGKVKVAVALKSQDVDAQYVRIGSLSFTGISPVSGVFDLINGTTASPGCAISSLGSGWYLCQIEFTLASDRVGQMQLALMRTDTDATWGEANGGTGTDGSEAFSYTAVHFYRSDLGGMADNPDQTVAGLEKYVPTTSAAVYLPRRNAYYYNGSSWVKGGVRFESAAATNLTTYSNDLTQTDWTKGGATATTTRLTDTAGAGMHFVYDTVSAFGQHVVSFVLSNVDNNKVWAYIHNLTTALAFFDASTGTLGTVSGSASPTAGMIPFGAGKYLCWISASATIGAYGIGLTDGTEVTTYTASGGDGADIEHVQFEAGAIPTSRIPTTGSTVTRAAETLSIAGADTPANTTAMTISMKGLMTYADNSSGSEVVFALWQNDLANFIGMSLNTISTRTGQVLFEQRESVSGLDQVNSPTTSYAPGINVPFNIASRHGSAFINGAVDGTALTANLTPTALADLSSTTLELSKTFNGFISEFRMWGADIGDSGIAEVTAS